MRFRTWHDDVGFGEGPLFAHDGTTWATSIDRGVVYRFLPGSTRSTYATGGGPNGATEGPFGEIFVAQNGGWNPTTRVGLRPGGVQVISTTGEIRTLNEDPVAPNDLCFGPDGMLYVTDPTRRRPSRDDGRLWRIDPETGASELLRSVGWYPNGIGFGLENDAMYVADMGAQRIVRFPLVEGVLGEPETAVQMTEGHPDGFAFDVQGNLVVCAVSFDPDRVGTIQVWSADGKLLDRFEPGSGRLYTNVALADDRTMVVTDAQHGTLLVADEWPIAGLALHPHRT